MLPPDVRHFTGRADAIAELTAVLTTDRAVPVVSGMGGVGKTALAVHVAHRVADRFPDGRLYVDLRGLSERPADPRHVLDRLLRTLGLDDIPDDHAERAALYRSELAGRRILVLLDNARDAAQVRDLLPGTDGSAALVTSRAQLADLPGVRLLPLDVLEPAEAVGLLGRLAGPDRVRAERGAALDTVAACGFLPLAIRIAGARLAARPDLPLADVEPPRLDVCFRPGYERLDRKQAGAFRLLRLADGPGFSAGAAAATLGLPRHDAEDLVEELVDRSLLESPEPGRYRYHALLRRFAGHAGPEAAGLRAGALQRLLDFYLTAAHRARGLLERPGADGRQAGTWLFVEFTAVFAAIDRAAREPDGPLDAAASTLLAMAEFLDFQWHLRELGTAAHTVIKAAHVRGEQETLARAALVLGRLHWWRREFGEARPCLERAARDGDWPTMALALETLALIDRSMPLVDRAQKIWRMLGDGAGRARSHVRRGRVEVLRHGLPDVAVTECELGLRGFAERDDQDGQAYAACALGMALTAAGRPAEALDRHAQSLAHARLTGIPVREAGNLLHMAAALLAVGRPSAAADHARQAIAIFQTTGRPYDQARALFTLGRAHLALHDPTPARRHLTAAHDLFTTQKAVEAATTHRYLANLTRN